MFSHPMLFPKLSKEVLVLWVNDIYKKCSTLYVLLDDKCSLSTLFLLTICCLKFSKFYTKYDFRRNFTLNSISNMKNNARSWKNSAYSRKNNGCSRKNNACSRKTMRVQGKTMRVQGKTMRVQGKTMRVQEKTMHVQEKQ